MRHSRSRSQVCPLALSSIARRIWSSCSGTKHPLPRANFSASDHGTCLVLHADSISSAYSRLIVTGYGIINATGELWRVQRNAGLKFFSGANLDVMVEDVLPDVYAETTRENLLQAAKDNSVVDIQKVFLDLTTTVVGNMAYDAGLSFALC